MGLRCRDDGGRVIGHRVIVVGVLWNPNSLHTHPKRLILLLSEFSKIGGTPLQGVEEDFQVTPGGDLAGVHEVAKRPALHNNAIRPGDGVLKVVVIHPRDGTAGCLDYDVNNLLISRHYVKQNLMTHPLLNAQVLR